MRALGIVAFLLCASTLALAAAGCGGGGGGGGPTYAGTKPSTWAANVCGAMREWTQGLLADGKKVALGDAAPAKVKDRLIRFLVTSVQMSDAMIAKVKATGAPAVKDGPKLQAELESRLRLTRKSLKDAVPTAQALPTKDTRTLEAGATALGKDIDKKLNAIGSGFTRLSAKYNDKDLNKAVSKEPSCNSLVG